MSNEALEKLDNALERLDNLDKTLNGALAENEKLKKRVEELEKYYLVTYETAKKHKQLNDQYKKECGTLPSTERSGSRNNK